MQLAGADADEGVGRRVVALLGDLELAVGAAPGPPELQLGRVQEPLPGLRADRVAEQRLVVAAAQPVGAAVLLVGPADREVVAAGDLVVDDRAVAHRRADQLEAALAQGREELVERTPVDRDRLRHSAGRHRHLG